MDANVQPGTISFQLNGEAVKTDAMPGERLSYTLRERLDARDVKVGCNAGDCGACSVLVDGEVMCACLMATQQAEGAKIDTHRGLSQSDATMVALADRFQEFQAAQCGICTPGMMVSALALLRDNPSPSEDDIKDALGGVLCRCTGYRKIIEAVAAVSRVPNLSNSGDGSVGSSIERLDGVPKVTGTERFGDDVAPADCLSLILIRSPYSHARFEIGDVDAFLATHSGVECVLTAADITGLNGHGVIPGFENQPVFAESVARHKGEAVAAVVGNADAMQLFDVADFPVTFEELTPAMTVSEATADGAAQLHANADGNIMCGGFVETGNAEGALKGADMSLTARYQSAFVEHAYIEPEAGYAEMDGDTVVIHACTQAPVMDQEATAKILGWPKDRVRMVPTAVGGGFGAKLDVSIQPFVALAAIKTGKPVRVTLSRTESMQTTTKRHPSDITLTIGAKADGTISGFHFEGDFNTGAYASWGPTVANRVPVHASGPYRIEDYTARSRGIYTHCPPAGAFRGFGVPQSAIAQECVFDELAEKLGLDPLAFRLKNVLENSEPTVCGQVFDQGVGIKACFEALADPWEKAKADCAAFNAKNSTVKRGTGLGAGWYGCGNTSLPNPSTIKAGITPEGALYLHQGAMDIGQGANTVIAQIFAEALGVSVFTVNIIGPDTAVTPDAGKTSASRQTFVSGNAARLSGEAMRRDILKRCNASEDAIIEIKEGVIRVTNGETHKVALDQITPNDNGYVIQSEETYDPPTKPLDAKGQGVPYAQFGYAAHLIVVEVDTELGTVKPISVIAAHDVGRAINPLLVEGQVHGGVAQGLGMALMEEYIPTRTDNLHDYLIPTIGDIPPIETLIIEEPDAHGPYGAKGLGEHALIPTAPAILNAIYNATGARIRQVPATPSIVRAHIRALEGDDE